GVPPTLDALRDPLGAPLGRHQAPRELVPVETLPRTALWNLQRGGPDVGPQAANDELDEDAFLVSSGPRRQFPTDLDAWARWAGAVVVGVAAFETLAYLISGSLSGWATGIGDEPVSPSPAS